MAKLSRTNQRKVKAKLKDEELKIGGGAGGLNVHHSKK